MRPLRHLRAFIFVTSGSRWPPLGDGDVRQHVVEYHLERHVQNQVLGRVLDANDIGHHPGPFLELHNRDGVWGIVLETGRWPMVDHVGVKRSLARRLKPLEVLGHALGAVESGVEKDFAADVWAAV